MKILGLGDNTIDTYVDRNEQYPGGNAVNVAVMARKCGTHAAYCGCLGADAGGNLLQDALAQEEIDTSHCRICSTPNARAFIAHNDGDRRFIRSEPGCRAEWNGFSTDDRRYFSTFDIVHSSVFSGLDSYRESLRASIRLWSFDFSEKWNDENLAAWLPSLDCAFLSYPTGSDSEVREKARSCASMGAKTVVITRGQLPVYAWHNGRDAWHQPASVKVIDSLGAGDGFIAAFLIAMNQQKPLEEALADGSKNAALVCQQFGAFGHGQNWRANADGHVH